MEGITHLVLIAATCILVHATSIEAACRFPETMYATKGPWRIYSEDGTHNNNMYVRREVTLSGSDMKVVHQGGRTKVYRCDTDIGKDMTYAVSVHEEGQSTHYTCVQFIIRATNVLQWQITPLRDKKDSSESQCLDSEQRLQLVDSPFVYNAEGMWAEKRNQFKEYVSCPLDGGYVVTGWRDETGKENCDSSVFPMMKLENECEKGEGLKFSFVKRKSSAEKKCPIPDDDNRRYYCRAHWTHGPWTFMLFVDYSDPILYTLMCVRYPTNKGKVFTIDMFRDAVCDTTANFERSKHRFHIDLIKYPAPSLCNDTYPNCQHIVNNTMLCHDYKVVESCTQSCKACENAGNIFDEKPDIISNDFVGNWMKDTKSQGQEIVTIGKKTIIIPSLGEYKLVGDMCYGSKTIGTKPAAEYLFLHTFANGCTARASRIALAYLSRSVIGLHISDPTVAEIDVKMRFNDQTRPDRKDFFWELRDNTDVWCMDAGYGLPFNQQIESFRTRQFSWFSLVNINRNANTVKCEIAKLTLDIRTVKGTRCHAVMAQTRTDGFSLTFTSCTDNNVTRSPQPLHFSCLGDHRGTALRRFIITKSSNVNTLLDTQYMCWVFSAKYPRTIYWMRVSECDSKSDDFVKKGVREALAVVDFEQGTSSSAKVQSNILSLYGVVFAKLLWFY